MPYELSPDEKLTDSIRRCAREQVERAVGELREGVDADPVGAIHSARKSIKKERALLRLARAGLPTDQRKAENATLRDAARTVSRLRDADVMIETLEALAKRYAGQLPDSVFAAIRERLGADRETAHDRAANSELVVEVIQVFDGVAGRVEQWEIKLGGWKAIGQGLERTYRQGRAAMKRATREPSAENLHEWRKRVKDLWYDARLLGPVCGPIARGQALEAEHLSELLGEDHDLAMLRQNLARIAREVPVDTDAVAALIDHRRDQLESEAVLVGRRLYAEPPALFVRRSKRLWKAGRKRASLATDARPIASLATDAQPIRRRRPKTRSNASSSP